MRRTYGREVTDLHPAVWQRVLDDARGDPLVTAELARAWRNVEAPGADLLRRFPPVTERLRGMLVPEGLPANCSMTLLVAALDFGDEVAEILHAAGLAVGADLTGAVFDAAVAAGLVTLADGRLRFTHRLGKAAVVASAAPGQLEQAHTALDLTAEHAPHRRAWHRAQTATHPDEDVAEALESTAAAGPVDALRRLERAARLTPDPVRRRHRLLRAATHAFELGRPELGEHLLATAEQLEPAGHLRSHAVRLRFLAEPRPTWDPLRPLCATARELARGDEQDAALDVLLTAAYQLWWTDPDPAARGHVDNALRHVAAHPRDPRHTAVHAVAAPLARTPDPLTAPPDAVTTWLLGFAALARGDCPAAVDLLGASAAALRAGGRLGLLTHVRGLHAEAAVAVGAWDTAAEAAEECLDLAVRTGQPVWRAQAQVCVALLCALRGDADGARRHAAEAERTVTPGRFPALAALIRLARGVTLLTTGSHLDAYETLRRLFDRDDAHFCRRIAGYAIGYLVEAGYCGRHEDARSILAPYELATTPLFAANMCYARALLAEPGTAEPLFERARHLDPHEWPWLRARAELAWAVWLRLQRRVVESRSSLRSAMHAFEALGAAAWAERARSELDATGVDVRRDRSAVALTPQELQIARLAATGLSNRQIGERMFLSHRTVGSHLYKIFPKLNVTSRAQLAARIAGSRMAQPGRDK